jgi:hypothetical protein
MLRKVFTSFACCVQIDSMHRMEIEVTSVIGRYINYWDSVHRISYERIIYNDALEDA